MPFDGKILLADDEAHIRKFIGLLLRQLGSPTIIEAVNGAQAVELYQSEHPDLVFLDVNMPELDGLQALEKIRAIDPDCAVIMLTSLTTRQVIERAAALGAVNYIRKDTPKEEILKALRQTIDSIFGPDDEASNP
ncbi:MAG TPA: response regulator transcription factor [Opitutaceae bacterium]|jgi:two-component system chemotaxis response regulator CheY|nr:response regulator transcription factor [Opitutaceae bacterium]